MFIFYTLLGGLVICGLFMAVVQDNAALILFSGIALVLTFLGAFANFYGDNDGGNAV